MDRLRASYRKMWRHNPARFLARLHARRALKKGNGGSFTPLEWKAIKRLQGFACLMCGRKEPEITLTVDHVVALTRGGQNCARNLQALCGSCNSSKGTREIDLRPNGPWF
jgi:5-methylcytosine-specific restriction enzyme A